MNSQEIDRQARALAAERGWGDWTEDPRSQMIFLLLGAREDARHGLGRHVESLRHDLDRIDKVLKAPSPILNTLGELQQRPAAVEAAVGQFAAADKALRRYLETFPAKGE